MREEERRERERTGRREMGRQSEGRGEKGETKGWKKREGDTNGERREGVRRGEKVK